MHLAQCMIYFRGKEVVSLTWEKWTRDSQKDGKAKKDMVHYNSHTNMSFFAFTIHKS